LGKAEAAKVCRMGSSDFSSSDGASLDAQPAHDAKAVRRISLPLMGTSIIFQHTQSIHHANVLAIAIDDGGGQKYNASHMGQRKLSLIEDFVQELIEGTFGRLFGGRLEPLDVATHLIKAIEDVERSLSATSHYTVALNPDDYRELQENNPHLPAELANAAEQLGRQIGLDGYPKPVVQVVADPSLRRRRLRIETEEAFVEPEFDQQTQIFRHKKPIEEDLQLIRELDAFLIVQGRRHIALDKPVITIGRRIDNNIVLDHPSVSRQQAQVRWRFGSFVLYDISNRSRTLVNGHPAQEHVLRPGDVISFGEALVVYGEGMGNSASSKRGNGDDETLAFSRGSG
jgi:hypothetical protein